MSAPGSASTASLADLLAGLSIAGLLLPEAVAYSGVANLPPQAGVIALFAGLFCYGLIGASRFAVVSATSSSAAVLASALLALDATAAAQRVQLAMFLVAGARLNLEESPDLDSTALETLGEFFTWLTLRGVSIRVARLKDAAREALARAAFAQLPAAALDYSSVDDAVRGESVTAPAAAAVNS